MISRRYEGPVYFGASLIVVLAAWEAVMRAGLVDPLFLSSPSAIAVRGWELFFQTGEIYPHLRVSLIEGVAGFGLAVVIGIPLGLLMGRVRRMRLLFEPYVTALYSMPIVAILPLLIIWFGIGMLSKIAIIFLGGIFPIIITTAAGARTVDAGLVEAALSFKATSYQVFHKIVFPACLPYIIAGLRLGIGRVLIMIVVAEMYAATAGIGFFVMHAGSVFDTTGAFVGVVALVTAGVALSEGLRATERFLAPWMLTDD